MSQPLPLCRQQLRFPQPDSIVSGQTEGFFHDHPMMAAATDGGNGPERVFNSVHRHADLLLGAKPGFSRRSARLALRFCSPGRGLVSFPAASQDLS